jgi:uncharacterized damage-inducible protein DinB
MVEAAAAADLRYLIGKFKWEGQTTDEQRRQHIDEIAAAPARLRDAVRGLNEQQLNAPYRPGGWSVRQVVHHLPDSHMNSYVRFKLALTEENPTIKPYEEARWAELTDGRIAPVEVSLMLLDSLHHRWVMLLRSLTPAEWLRTFTHPELGPMTLDKTAALYAWHGKHHVAHITSLRERNGWR